MCELLVSRLLELERRHWGDEVELARRFEQVRSCSLWSFHHRTS